MTEVSTVIAFFVLVGLLAVRILQQRRAQHDITAEWQTTSRLAPDDTTPELTAKAPLRQRAGTSRSETITI